MDSTLGHVASRWLWRMDKRAKRAMEHSAQRWGGLARLSKGGLLSPEPASCAKADSSPSVPNGCERAEVNVRLSDLD
jgi:hypothetical protein